MESSKIESRPPPRFGGERARKAGEEPFDLLAVSGRRGHSPMHDCKTSRRSRHFALVLAAVDQEAGKDACAACYAANPFACKMGLSIRRRFPPRISSFDDSGMSAPITLASCEPKLRPPTSLP
jgi:hypothetical protein